MVEYGATKIKKRALETQGPDISPPIPSHVGVSGLEIESTEIRGLSGRSLNT